MERGRSPVPQPQSGGLAAARNPGAHRLLSRAQSPAAGTELPGVAAGSPSMELGHGPRAEASPQQAAASALESKIAADAGPGSAGTPTPALVVPASQAKQTHLGKLCLLLRAGSGRAPTSFFPVQP